MQAIEAWNLKPLADLTPAEFQDWRVLVESRSGLVLDERRRIFLQTALTARMRELGVEAYRDYYHRVTSGTLGAVEWSTLLDRLTVQETRFFRHPASFGCLTRFLRARFAASEQPLALWSVGCSSGEEAYSMAICAAEAACASERPLTAFGVTATDISLNALARGRAGSYSEARLAQLPSEWRARYLTRRPDGLNTIDPELAERVCFARLNVLELAGAPWSGMDVIFCQNLLIYFRRWRRREILEHLAERLAPGGLLVVGVGEVVGWQHPALSPVANDEVLAFIRKTV